MGLRGRLPKLKLHPAEGLADLTPPDWLSDDAADYWQRHAQHLAKNQLLTAATADAFANHCDMWGRICLLRGEPTTKTYLDLQAKFRASEKVFRLVPIDKPGATPEHRHEDKSEFDF